MSTKAERAAQAIEVQAVVDRLETRRHDLKATLEQALDEQKPGLNEQLDLDDHYLRMARAELAELTAK